MISTADLRKTWAGHTVVEQLCDALDTVTAERDEARARHDELLAAARLWRDGNMALKTCGATQTPEYWSAIRQISDGESAIYRALASATTPRDA